MTNLIKLEKFTVVFLKEGDKYGLNNCKTADKPLVEFYDNRYDHDEHGQFVSRYYAESLAHSPTTLNLDGGVAEWTVPQEIMAVVNKFINYNVKANR